MALKNLRPAAAPAASAPPTLSPQEQAIADLQAQIAKLQGAAPAAAPAEPAPLVAEAAPVQAVAVPAQAQAVAVQGAANPLLALFANNGLTVSSAGSASKAVTKHGGQPLVLPTINITSGNTGGQFAANDRNSPEHLRVLPQGRIPLFGVFLAYRYDVTGWPVDFDNKDEDTRPCWSAIIPSSDEAAAELLTQYGEAYQFTAKVDRCNKFDTPSGPGHLRPSFQSLVFLPPIQNTMPGTPTWNGGLAVIQTPYSPVSVQRSADSIIRHADAATNSIPPFACQFEVRTNQETNKAGTQAWKVHHLDFSALAFPGAQAEAVLTAFRDWFATLDDAAKKVYNDWTAGKDNPMNQAARQALTLGAGLRNRRP
jgi:hypothetical protein